MIANASKSIYNKGKKCFIYYNEEGYSFIIKESLRYVKGGDVMANTSAVYARIDTNLKDNAEAILNQLGITPSSAIQMLYSQIVLNKGIPFALKLPASHLADVSTMSREELDRELQKGVDSIQAGRVYAADEVDRILEKEFGM